MSGGGGNLRFRGETEILMPTALEFEFLDNGQAQFISGNNEVVAELTYEKNTWINIAYEVDLNHEYRLRRNQQHRTGHPHS